MKTFKILALSLFVSLFAVACSDEDAESTEPAVFPVNGPSEIPTDIY